MSAVDTVVKLLGVWGLVCGHVNSQYIQLVVPIWGSDKLCYYDKMK